MEFIKTPNRIYLNDESGKTLAEVTFPEVEKDVVDINHTFVDNSLRGQGIAGQLMQQAAEYLRQNNKKAVLSCSYAIKWFGEHKEYSDIIK